MAAYIPGEAQSALMRGRTRLITRVVQIIGDESPNTDTGTDQIVGTAIVDQLLVDGVFSSDFFDKEDVTPSS
jgi:hypothetical protein